MSKRYYGIDLLRSVSMLMIIVLHILGNGGVLEAAREGSAGWSAAWLLETICMCSVNCFGLVSGYVLSGGNYRYSKIVSLWIRVVVECLAVTAVMSFVFPGSVTVQDWVKAVTPIYNSVYWYFTGYFALFFFVPFINKMIAALSKREMLVLAGSIVMLFCFLNNMARTEIYYMNAGYSFCWLLCLYVLGAVMRRLDLKENFMGGWLYAVFAVPILIAWALELWLKILRIIGFTSPLILASAAALLLLIRRVKISSPRTVKIVSMLNRTSFGVYIIHTNPLVWGLVLFQSFVPFADLSAPLLVLAVFAAAAAIYALSTAGDWLVEKLLKLLGIDLLEAKIDKFGERLLNTRQKAQNSSINE